MIRSVKIFIDGKCFVSSEYLLAVKKFLSTKGMVATENVPPNKCLQTT